MRIPTDLRWELIDKTLGEGGQAQVFLVKDKVAESEGVWALKALKRGEPGQAYERFSPEVSAIKKLQHSNVIKIVNSSSIEDKFQFCVMEYIDGARPLEKVIKTERNPYYENPLRSLWLFEQIC